MTRWLKFSSITSMRACAPKHIPITSSTRQNFCFTVYYFLQNLCSKKGKSPDDYDQRND